MNAPTPDDLRRRIFSVIPAATWQMEQLLALLDIVIDESVPSAAVECRIRPRLLVNPHFVAEYCQTDEHLFVLVMHELLHVVLGHTRLFDRPTYAHNIAFDAVINAMLCRQFPDPIYSDFFARVNPRMDFPSRLLRPPAGWPDTTCFEPDATASERRVLGLLYGPDQNGVTYLDVFQLLVETCALPEDSLSVLLGNHADPAADPTEGNLLREVVAKIVGSWPRPPMNLGGRDEGGDSLSWRMAPPADPRASLRAALSRLLRRAGVLRQERGGPTKIGRIRRERTVETVIPQARDRRAAAWQAIHGAPPVLFHGQTAELRNGRVPVPVAHVYLDVSGSMAGALPTLGGALARPHRDGQLRLYAFSTVVDEVRPRQLHGGDIRNTLGTDINCVLAHLAEIPANRRPRRAVILTDGWIGTARADLLADLRAARMRFVAGLTPDGSSSDLEALGADIIRLPL